MVQANDPFVSFKGVQKSYDGETLVVKNLNLDIASGEFLTMLGPSGSGKTTCLMMLAGFETATHGDIELGGRPINNIPPHKRGIGMVFQNYALFPHMTVGENLAFPLKVRNMPTGRSRRQSSRSAGHGSDACLYRSETGAIVGWTATADRAGPGVGV
jgi:putative spermidine/putrescine transport system ATP-binding protein